MSELIFDLNASAGRIKPMHSVNNGPVKARATQARSNFDTFKDARIPFVRTHDASYFSGYGGEHTVDVHLIFPNFDADENDPQSYDFTLTDRYLETILDAGSEVFYRLGSKIEHTVKKYGTLPPKDFHKWARICEHIIRHMNEGWADGHHYGIRYWEIWNEPDLEDGATWGGTIEQFIDLYAITAKHLKSCFPDLKIGGPALSWRFDDFMPPFLSRLKAENISLDFFSWHAYAFDPHVLIQCGNTARRYLDEYGFTETESILDEWNYVENWTTLWVRSLQEEQGLRGAAFIAASMSACQYSSVDHLMYYDARLNTAMNGMYDTTSLRPRKGYYPFKMFSYLYELENAVSVTSDDDTVYCVGAYRDGRFAAMITHYSPDKNADFASVSLSIRGIKPDSVLECFLVDEDRVMTPISPIILRDGKAELFMSPDSILFIKNY